MEEDEKNSIKGCLILVSKFADKTLELKPPNQACWDRDVPRSSTLTVGLSQRAHPLKGRVHIVAPSCCLVWPWVRRAQDHLEMILLSNSSSHVYHALQCHLCLPTEHLSLSRWMAPEAKESPLSHVFPNNDMVSGFCWSWEQNHSHPAKCFRISSTTQCGLSLFFFHSPSITSLLECLYYKLLVYVTWFLGLCLSSPHFFKITFLFPQLFLTLSSNCSL